MIVIILIMIRRMMIMVMIMMMLMKITITMIRTWNSASLLVRLDMLLLGADLVKPFTRNDHRGDHRHNKKMMIINQTIMIFIIIMMIITKRKVIQSSKTCLRLCRTGCSAVVAGRLGWCRPAHHHHLLIKHNQCHHQYHHNRWLSSLWSPCTARSTGWLVASPSHSLKWLWPEKSSWLW